MVSEAAKKVAAEVTAVLKPKHAELAEYLRTHTDDYRTKLNALAAFKLARNDKRYGEVVKELVLKVRDDYRGEMARRQKESGRATA